MKSAITVHHLKKSFHTVEVFRDLNLSLEDKKITTLLGPNGSGKSTLLHILSGITPKDGGEISFPDFDPFALSFIFQNYRDSLLPWRTNFANLAFPLEIQNKSPKYIAQRIREIQKLFNLPLDWQGYPYQLSGGQQQMLALMRAFVTHPKILLIDEPFSALDYENNLRARNSLQKYFLLFRPTILLITHNIEEALHLSEKILLLSQKPTRIMKIFNNPLPYPRTLASLQTKPLNRLKNALFSDFQKTLRI